MGVDAFKGRAVELKNKVGRQAEPNPWWGGDLRRELELGRLLGQRLQESLKGENRHSMVDIEACCWS